MTLSGSAQIKVDMTETKALDLSVARDPVAIDENNAFTDGAAADQVQVAWHDTITLADGGNEEIDLAGGKKNAFGETVTLTNVKILYLKNNSEDADLEVGGAAANEFLMIKATGDAVLIKPGGTMILMAPDADGYPITGGTGDLLKIEHSGAGSSTMAVDIYIAGEGTAVIV